MKRIKHFNVERGFISKLLEDKDMKLIKDQQIKSSFFTGDNKRVYTYIQQLFKETGEVPTHRALNQKFPNFTLETYKSNGEEIVGTEETLTYWCSELRKKNMHNQTADVIEEVAEMLNSGDTEGAYSLMKKGVWTIEDEVVVTSSVDITKNTDDRIEAYKERKKNQGMMGIPTGIPHLDNILKGLAKETLTTLIATSGVGKTWFLVLIGAHAQLNGYRVCVFLTEMSTDIMLDRFEAMLFGMLYGELNYNDFKSGSLSPDKEKEYFDFLETTLPRLEPLTIETATGVSSVVSVVERDRPDLVLIDGVYLMEDEQGARDDWLRVAHITRDLKKIAKSWSIPILINTQADKNTSKKTGPELGSIMYTQSVGQDSDNVLALYRDEIMLQDREMGVKVLKQREGTLGKVINNWNFDTMDFSSIYSEGNSSNDIEDTDNNVIGI